MSNLHVGARAPWAVPFVLATGAIDGTGVLRVIVRIVLPDGAGTVDVDVAPSVSSVSSVTALWALAADGSSVTTEGIATCRAFFYGAANALLGWTTTFQLPIDKNPVPFPVIP